MKNVSKVKFLLVALLMAAAAIVGTGIVKPQPSQAVVASIIQHMNDEGYDEPFLVKCKNLSTHYVHEGERSDWKCGTMIQIYVNPGTRIVCQLGTGDWFLAEDTTGWRNVRDLGTDYCVYQLD